MKWPSSWYKARLFCTLFDLLLSLSDEDNGNHSLLLLIVEVGVGAFQNTLYNAVAIPSGGILSGDGGLGATATLRGLDIVGVSPNNFMFDYVRDSPIWVGLMTMMTTMKTTLSGMDPPGNCTNILLRTVHGMAELLQFATSSTNTIMTRLTLCSVVDQWCALSEIHRVLSWPMSKYLYWEHVLSKDNAGLASTQRAPRTL
jgi:hypothetical protein